jgi:3-hydroxyisobutyrate dehydrogenase-like beta-hydroxyacid dehydrogenase
MGISKVGFIGTGLMGSRMAKALKRKGFHVAVWNRSPDKSSALKSAGIAVAPTIAQLTKQVDAVCTCVADVAALEDVALSPSGVLSAAQSGLLFIDFSTVSVPLIKRIGDECATLGIDFADAPVTGSKNGAENATLTIMTGCDQATLKRSQPIFDAVGSKTIHCGPLGTGTQVKLAGNALIASMLQSFSEGLLLTAKAGVDPRVFLEVIQHSGFRSPYFEFKGAAILARDFETHFSIDLMHKDLALFLDNAASHKVPTPTAAAVREVYALARAAGKGDLDIAAVLTVFEQLTQTEVRVAKESSGV